MNSEEEITLEEVQQAVAQKGMAGIIPLYRVHRGSFLSFVRRYSKDRDLCLQSYHDAVIELYRAIVTKTYDPKQSKLKTYLFNLGKNKLINRLNKERIYNNRVSSNDISPLSRPYENEEQQLTENKNQGSMITEINREFDRLGDKCKKLILYFYYDALDADEIAKIMGYDNVQVVYSSKSRCLKQLKKLVHNRRNGAES